MRKQSGLTLVELMISILLGLILMVGVIQMFVGSKNTFYSQQALSRVQETGRFAVEHLTRDIRMAGYSGCFSRFSDNTAATVDSTLNDQSTFRWDYETFIKGYTYVGTALDFMAASPTGAGITPLANTDVLVISSATGSGIVVGKNNNGAQLFASSPSGNKAACTPTDRCDGLADGDILIVTDCQKARIFQASGVNIGGGGSPFLNIQHAAAGTPGNTASMVSWGGANPDKVFEPGSQIIQMRKVIYYIKNNTAGIPSLYQWDNGVDSELVEGVEDMDLTFGRDTTKDLAPDSYDSATAVGTNWPQVVSVHAELLVRSAETDLLPEAQSYKFPLSAATAVTATDKAMRQVFTVTVGIRSRLP